MTKKKSTQKKPQTQETTTQIDPRQEVMKELLDVATQLALCDPGDQEELSILLPRLRKTLKKMLRLMRQG